MREIPYNHEPGKLPATLRKIPLFSRLEESSLDGISVIAASSNSMPVMSSSPREMTAPKSFSY